MNQYLKSILAICILFSIGQTAVAQDFDECIDFDDIELGQYGKATDYTPGTTLFIDEGVKISLDSFLYFNGSKDLLNITIEDEPIFNGNPEELLDDEYVFISNVNMVFDFSGLPETTTQVCFNFLDGGGQENIAVNGQPLLPVQSFREIDGQEIAPGVTAGVQFSNGFDFPAGTLCLNGKIETLTLGGQEFAMDDLCFYTEDLNDDFCNFREFEVQAKPCTPNGVFFAEVKFEVDNPGSGYYVVANNETFGPFDYTAADQTEIGPLPADGSLYVFSIRDKDNPDCQKTYRLESENCQTTNCTIIDPVIDLRYCDDDSSTDDDDNCLFVDFEHLATVIVNFQLYFNGELFETYSSEDLPLYIDDDELPETSSGVVEVKICADNIAECCFSKTIRLDDDDDDDCRITNFVAEPTPCDENGDVYIKMDFDYEDVSEKFALWQNGNEIGTYAYTDLPLRIGPYPGNIDQTFEFKVFDLEYDDCYAETRIEGLDCGNACELGEGTAEDIECLSDARYRVTIDFRHGDREGSFYLRSRGGFEEAYRYSDLPLRVVLPLPGDGLDEIKIQDKENPDCYTYIEYRISCENPCQIGDIRLRNLECSASGEYFVTVDFEHNNREGTFLLQTRSGFERRYNYDDLPVRINGRLTNSGLDEIKIQDLDDPECITSREFELDCGTDDCNISNLRVTPVDCTEDKFWLSIRFDARDVGRSGYFVFVDGQIFGPFDYNNSQTPPLIGPFDADDDNIFDVLVLDIDDPACYAYTELTDIDCDDDCTISNLVASVGECYNDGTFDLKIDFQSVGSADGAFDVKFRDQVVGTYRLNELPVTVNLPAANTGNSPNETITVCLRDDDDDDDYECCLRAEFTLPDCQSQLPCGIGEIQAEISNCNEDGTFAVKLDFRHENTGRGFKVSGNGESYGEFSYEQLPIELGPFRGDGETRYEFIVQDLEREGCKNDIVLEPVACTVEVWPGDANNNNRADHFDLLNIGIAFGTQGPPRANPSIAWEGFNALVWDQAFDDGNNYAHADANGDGVVDFEDKEAIAQNYGLTNANDIEAVPQLPGTDIDPPIFVDLPNNGNLPSGLAFSVPVILGTSDNFIEDLYGIAFTIDFDPTIIDPASIEISYPKSWLGEENTNLITFDRVDQERGRIHVAITRIDQVNASGFGSVALVSGIIDDIAGRIIGDIEINNVYAINTFLRRIPLQTWKQRIQVKSQDEVPGRIDLRRNVRIIPNPAHHQVQVYTPYATPVESIQILDANGKPVREPVQNTDSISLEGLPQGIYMLRIKVGEHIIHERVVKM